MQSKLSSVAMQYHAASANKTHAFGKSSPFGKRLNSSPLFLGGVSFRQLLCHQVTKSK